MREAEPPVQNMHLDILNKTKGCAMIREATAHLRMCPPRDPQRDGPDMSLFDEIARALGKRKADQKSEIAEFGASFTETKSQLQDFEARLARVENAVQQFVSVFEKKLDDLADRGRDAKRQTDEELAPLRRDLDTYIDILEKSIEAQFDMARRQEIRRLLTTARAKRTRISNVINRRAANDG
jgi:hypothetical protein